MKSPSSPAGVNIPAGAITSRLSPGRRLLHSQLEPRAATRLTVTRRASSSPGVLDME
jgi:hypothetical protein